MTVMHQPEPLTATSTDWVVEDIPAGTFRVNRAALVDESVSRDEMRSIFERCWLYVGHESEIPEPGDFRGRDVGNRPLVFWHGHDGVRRVFYNSCRHRGALVCRVPQGNCKSMNCFYHAWTYGSTGALNGLPGEEGYSETFDRARMGLLSPAKVESYRGFVFACFDPDAVDLRTYLAGAADYIDLVADQAESMEIVPGAHEFSTDANWKMYVENSVDGYHVLPLHVTYFEYLEQAQGGRPSTRSARPSASATGTRRSGCAGRGRGRWPAGRPPSERATANASTPPTPSWSASTGRSGPS
jgi:phenylpropionate dioxygenase-like ring-hydroxylating dioxygenase large terminal subunit